MEFLRTILILVIIILIFWTIWVLFLTIINFWKTKRLFKSSYNSVWKSTFSTSIIVLFFGFSFALIGGSINALERIEKSLTDLSINYNLHFAYAELDFLEINEDLSIESNKNDDKDYIDYSFDYQLESRINSIEDFLIYYFNNNPSILLFFVLLEGLKILSNIVVNDTFTNLVWKYELSYFMESEASSEGYYYVSLNNYNIRNMIIDLISGVGNSIDYYIVEDYTDSFLTQNTISYSTNEPLLVNDYQVVDSLTENGINDIYSDEFIGSDYNNLDYDVKIGVGYDWANLNGIEVGDVISLPQPFGPNFDALVVATIRMPQYTFPSFSSSKVIPSVENQTYILMDSKTFLNYFGSVASPKIYIGFSDLYNEVQTYDDYLNKTVSKRNQSYVNQLNLIFEAFFDNIQFYTFNNLNNFTSLQASMIFYQTKTMKLLNSFLLTIFLIIIIFVIAFLIKKKVNGSARELGTLKALGWKNTHIAVTYIAFPLTIILLGGTLALIIGIFFQQGWMTIWINNYLISSGSITITGFSIFLTFILPIFILLAISYLIVMFFLRKPAINLINNVIEYRPSLLVKMTGYMTKYFKSFTKGYKFKSLSRGLGKSFLLFTSIFFTIIVVSFGISGAYLITSVSNEIKSFINFENVFILDSNAVYSSEFVDLRYEDDNYLETRYTNQYMFTYSINWNDVKDFETREQVWSFAELYLNFDGDTSYERAVSMDEDFGNYILNTSFDNQNTYIPWQAFEILGYGLNYVLQAPLESEEDWANIPLPTSKLTFNEYQNIYNQYINLYNYNYFLKDKDQDFIYPNVTINTIIYNSEYLVPIYNTTIKWTNYFDEVTKEQINSVWDLGFSLDEIEYEEVIWRDNEWYLVDNPYLSLSDYLNEKYVIDENLSTTNNDYVLQYANVDITNEYTDELNNKRATAKISIYIRNDYVENISDSESNVFRQQWLLSFDYADDIDITFNISEDNIMLLENYQPKEVEIIKENGESMIVNTIPIIVDSTTLNKYNLQVGDIITTGYIDQEEELYNDLKIEKISNYIAFEIVGEIETKLFIGPITTNNFLDPNNQLLTYVFFQSGKSQQNVYSLTNNNYINGTNLIDDFSYSSSLRGSFEYIVNVNSIEEQIDTVVNLINLLFYFFAFFAAAIAIILILITLKDIVDNSKKEASILKALGYSNYKTTSIIISPYMWIMIFAVIISIPINLIFFAFLSKYIFINTGFSLWLGIPLFAWLFIILGIILLFILGFLITKVYFKRANPLEVINDN